MPFCNEYNHVRDSKDFTEQWLIIKSQIAITDSVPFSDFRFFWLLQEPKQKIKPPTQKSFFSSHFLRNHLRTKC